jgi:hypothetical protein
MSLAGSCVPRDLKNQLTDAPRPGVVVLVVLVLVAVPGALFSFPSSLVLGTDLGPTVVFDMGLCPLCACNLWLDIGRKNAEDVKLGTCVRLYELGGREPAALPGALFDVTPVFAVAAVDGREGGRPASPAGPVAPGIWGPSPPASESGRSDMAEEMTLMACPRPSDTVRPVGKLERPSSSARLREVLLVIAQCCSEYCAWV